ncbi:hypothetical protein [Duganella vulcania]|uniref:Uncharacterized protein n=1 Tax=Duganella vulcania TaxID=2692166 RepID=A0A845GSX3_9BURK|nr:hypothetical protein [Duganella vulcania]MYM96308.1 hypothetical protein [Duganella vulcania]
MNKKLKLFLFAIGIGAASAPAMASCIHYCVVEYKACMKSGQPADQCNEELTACEDACGG